MTARNVQSTFHYLIHFNKKTDTTFECLQIHIFQFGRLSFH